MPDYNNNGFLARNQNRTNDKQPEFKGQATVDGKEYWLAGWVKENDRGKYFSLKFEPKDAQQAAGEENQAAPSQEVPF